ncbi:uncharacterized protein N7483_002548 [Penicillium malachiteum]|uniref:uncharacterized protein n=1 Tax=Penicillium malachiteum TaxID=1324776 RepID=UPI0025499BE5|nr:uncharacterized protein N7483_002416 [Penicillium malachiteum]XP_056952134.1 uncharacterized protein N7483_002548 [Penicillium malachiteum]KAJ5737291.1 hypothetical protein N7483_002416 [Penicillium malachiteum]KAJ5737423.1 hypothetical protein N7483_002548 [Penicillium malachiteum]
MPSSSPRDLRDCAIGAVISAFGFCYFVIFFAQFLLFQFPTTQEMITDAIAVTAFSLCLIIWYLGVEFHYTLSALGGRDLVGYERSICQSGLFLIWAAALPTVVFLFPKQPFLQLGYTSALTLVVVERMLPSTISGDQGDTESIRYPGYMTALVLLCSVPTIHALAQPAPTASLLPTAFLWFLVTNAFGVAILLLRSFERAVGISKWYLSLHGAHMVMTYSLVTYSKAVLQAFASYNS